MESTSILLHSTALPFTSSLTAKTITGGNKNKFSLRHFNKHLHSNAPNANLHLKHPHKPIKSPFPLKLTRTQLLPHLNCSYSTSPQSHPFPEPLKILSFDKVKQTLLQVTPFDIIKLSAVLSVVIAATKWAVNLCLNPFFWMYFSWSWLFWPWFIAISLAFYGFYCFYKYSLGEASVFEQIGLVTAVFTWLTLVPPAFFNGYLQGWPVVFFFVYQYFFFFNVSVRKRLYGDYFMRDHDPKWDVNPPKWYRGLFCIGVMVSHWLAAFEGPELHLIPGGWSNAAMWVLVVVTLLMQYNSTLYLAKYSEKVVVPTAVVQFGPFRWVRHPIYSSTMLLFAAYFISLRAPLSLLFVVAVCLMYYDQKAKMEEALMIETFGERYLEYMNKVRYKFIPFVF
ncbi:uncharacterized protein LOC126686179 [Mercurialis annua]|uniref:uncharacterized protein LOC126686179 n=1 Tax=Mercurialis annua TaxID=3986 RepID=UPI0021607175|nr:uncharacterized protein LOC126686179 [Mercurialis annua]